MIVVKKPFQLIGLALSGLAMSPTGEIPKFVKSEPSDDNCIVGLYYSTKNGVIIASLIFMIMFLRNLNSHLLQIYVLAIHCLMAFVCTFFLGYISFINNPKFNQMIPSLMVGLLGMLGMVLLVDFILEWRYRG